ncbi:MAG: VWA domain-containing protein [Bdellovibrionales bacterium]|nr:VWA domain-containing protein [Bdellovibrionales bacterium]
MVVLFIILRLRQKRRLIKLFVGEFLFEKLLIQYSKRRENLKWTLIIVALALIVCSLVRPQWGYKWEEAKRRGVDLMIVLDVSQSMLAQDILPNRLERAKHEIIDLLRIVKGDRIGLVAFAGTSFVLCPLTLDYGAVQLFLNDVDTDLISLQGTALGSAINTSIEAFGTESPHSKAMILITDGEDHKGQAIEAAKKAASAGIRIYTIGIGQSDGAPIPDLEKGGFKKDQEGAMILTKLDEATLQSIANETHSTYVRSTSGDLDLEATYGHIRSHLEDQNFEVSKRKRFNERYQWPLFFALMILLFEPFISGGTRFEKP